MKILNSKIVSSLLASLFTVMLAHSTFAQEIFAPITTKAFAPALINPNQFSLLSITVTNNNTFAVDRLNFTDTLPPGVTVVNTVSNSCNGNLVANAGSGSVALTLGTIAASSSCTVRVNVTSANAGIYVNATGPVIFFPVGSEVPAPPGASAIATLVVVLSPSVEKEFIPDVVDNCGCSTLVITLRNPSSVATLTAPLVDRLPRDLHIVGTPNTTCTAGVVRATRSELILDSGSIPANGSCTVSVEVSSKCNGEFTNAIPAGDLRTTNGSNAETAFATVKFCCEHADEARESCLVENTTDFEENMSPIED